MSENISLSEEVYEALVREKGDRSFSEVIRDALDTARTLKEVSGEGILETGAFEDVQSNIETVCAGSPERLDEDAT